MGDFHFSRRSFLTAGGLGVASAVVPAVSASASVTAEAQLRALSGTDTDASAALLAFLNSGGTSKTIVGDYFLDQLVTVPHAVVDLVLAAGTRLKIRGSHIGVRRAGAIVFREIVGNMTAGKAFIYVRQPSLYKVGEYLLLSGNDVVPGSPDKYGYMRRVTAVSGTKVSIDGVLPRTMVLSPRTSRISLAPTLRIRGSGEIYSVNPSANKSSLVDFFATHTPLVEGINVHDSGGSGVSVTHSLGGKIACSIYDLLDDGTNYFGYGVNVAGATRGLVVAGVISRVRHAVTTNPPGSIVNIGPAGEPEDCRFEPIAKDCSDKAVDTHRIGWNTTIVPHVEGGRGGVQVRADNTHVIGGTIVGTAGPGVAVSSVVAAGTTIKDVSISYLKPSGTAVLCSAPTTITNVTIRDCYGTNIILKSNCRVIGGSISAGNSAGVSFLGSNNSVESIQLGSSVTTPYIQAAGTTNNFFSSVALVGGLLPAPTATAAPTLSGTAARGQQLAAGYCSWSVGPVVQTWNWFRDGVAIPTATGRTNPRYDVVTADVGKKLSVNVVAKRTGYVDGRSPTKTSAVVAM
jgi:hypothetical protein